MIILFDGRPCFYFVDVSLTNLRTINMCETINCDNAPQNNIHEHNNLCAVSANDMCAVCIIVVIADIQIYNVLLSETTSIHAQHKQMFVCTKEKANQK